MLKVLYIYRHHDMGYSIGRVFKPIEEEMRKYCEVDAVYLPVPNYSLKGLWKNIWTARKAVKQKHYDVVHITGAEHYLIPFLKKQNVVVTVHDIMYYSYLTGLKKKIWKYYFIDTLKHANFVTFISEYSEQQVFSVVDGLVAKSCVIPDAVDSLFKYFPKDFNKDCPTILHIGSLPRKNLTRTIEAIEGIKCKLRIIGKQPADILNLLNEKKINYSITYSLSDEQVYEEYKNCDIVNFVSLFEGFGMPVLEGQATGRIVICSNRSPIKDVAGNGAILVNPNNVNEIRDAYMCAINKGDYCKNIILKGLENVSNYKLEDITNQYFNLYKKVCYEKDN